MVRTKVSHSLLGIVVIVLSIHGYHSFQPQLIRDFANNARQQIPIYVRSNVEQSAPPAATNWPQNQEAPRANEQFSLEIFSVSHLTVKRISQNTES